MRHIIAKQQFYAESHKKKKEAEEECMAFLTTAHVGDIHLEEDHYFGDTAQCLEWFVTDAIRSPTWISLWLTGT
jgi:hypothetical protein